MEVDIRGTHALWRTLALKIHHNSHKRLVALEELVAGWIERSGQQSPHLSLSAFYPDSWAFDFTTHFLEKHASRVQELDLDLPHLQFNRFATETSARLPLLRRFSGDPSSLPNNHCSFALLEHSPLLRDFAFSGHILKLTPLYVPWG
ncbi:hypothetical protein C8F01DRAFT_1375390 [Mycena amicta]|nr:hypothetical protein C8F01DRAFT_1375390 [Mycena amicta]